MHLIQIQSFYNTILSISDIGEHIYLSRMKMTLARLLSWLASVLIQLAFIHRVTASDQSVRNGLSFLLVFFSCRFSSQQHLLGRFVPLSRIIKLSNFFFNNCSGTVQVCFSAMVRLGRVSVRHLCVASEPFFLLRLLHFSIAVKYLGALFVYVIRLELFGMKK